MITQAIPWSINSYARGAPWSGDIGWASWANNYARSFEWDDDQFVNNQFSHPYHGGLYFTAARTNGFDYWESLAFSFLNSWIWEYHAETFRPAINDWLMTSIGGAAIGEMTYRLAEKITDNTRDGWGRTWREAVGFVVSPVRGFDRGIKGQWSRQWGNPPDRMALVRSRFEIGVFGAKEAANNLKATEVPFVSGTRARSDFVPFQPAEKVTLGTARFVLRYGEVFEHHDEPFDAFEVDLQLAYGSAVAALNQATITGWLHVHHFDWAQHNRHAFVVTQRYEYFNNEVLQFGAQSFGAGLSSLFWADRAFRVRTRVEAEALVLGAIDSPYAELVNRTYDYGPGLGLLFDARLEHEGSEVVRLNVGNFLLRTANGGGSGTHNVAHGMLRAMVPVVGRLGVGGEYGYVRRDGIFRDFPDFVRDFDYVRLYLSWVTR